MASKKKSEEIIEKEPVIVEEQDILSEKEVEKLKPEEVIEVKAPEVKIKSEKVYFSNNINVCNTITTQRSGKKKLMM